MENLHFLDNNKGLTFEECLFIAEEKVIVDIIPTIKMKKKIIFSIEIGPFIPYQKCKVPLWIGKYLDSRNLCRLIPPKWLTQEGLKKLLLDEEKIGLNSLCKIDFHYYQIAHIFFQLKNDPFNGKGDKIKKLFQDLINRRQAKLKNNFKQLILPKIFDVSNMGLIELNFGSNECFHIFSDLENLWFNVLNESQIASQEVSQEITQLSQ